MDGNPKENRNKNWKTTKTSKRISNFCASRLSKTVSEGVELVSSKSDLQFSWGENLHRVLPNSWGEGAIYIFLCLFSSCKNLEKLVKKSLRFDSTKLWCANNCGLKNDECLKWMPSTRRILFCLELSPSDRPKNAGAPSTCWVVQYRQVQPSSFFQLARLRAESKERIKTIWVISNNRGKTPKWMLKIMENPIRNGMVWGENPLFSETSI